MPPTDKWKSNPDTGTKLANGSVRVSAPVYPLTMWHRCLDNVDGTLSIWMTSSKKIGYFLYDLQKLFSKRALLSKDVTQLSLGLRMILTACLPIDNFASLIKWICHLKERVTLDRMIFYRITDWTSGSSRRTVSLVVEDEAECHMTSFVGDDFLQYFDLHIHLKSDKKTWQIRSHFW